jgi:hypothetical protein
VGVFELVLGPWKQKKVWVMILPHLILMSTDRPTMIASHHLDPET